MSDVEKRLLMSILGCVCFGYATVSCLVFYRRMRERASRYRNLPLEGIVRSPNYSATFWISGLIGAVGFLISSWQLVLSLMTIMGH